MIRNQDGIGYKKVGHHHGPTKDKRLTNFIKKCLRLFIKLDPTLNLTKKTCHAHRRQSLLCNTRLYNFNSSGMLQM